jgi:hypothetical protein
MMSNAGGAWDNAKKYMEIELKAKGSEMHKATVVTLLIMLNLLNLLTLAIRSTNHTTLITMH